MTTSATVTPVPADLSTDAYIVLGLATCFMKVDGQVEEVLIIEPIPSAALATIISGVETSYQWALATTLGAVLVEDMCQKPAEFPEEARFCDEFLDRAYAAARTYQRYPDTQNAISIGTIYRELNHSTERKRVLNSHRVVRTEDNVKQHSHTHKVL